MKASGSTLKKILEQEIQYRVPIYQRTYDWEKKHCKQLFNDIISVGASNDRSSHFIGAITYVGRATQISEVPEYTIIDGQQRLTSLMLLLRALRDKPDESNGVTVGKINSLLLNVNQDMHDTRYHKMILTAGDDKSFKDIIRDGATEATNNVAVNYKYFVDEMAKNTNIVKIVWEGIKRLTVVPILIDESENAQAIFESMNSTGLDLSVTDMVQNYMLMHSTSAWQKKIYLEYWTPMEERFGYGRSDDFEAFLWTWVSMEKQERIIRRKIYPEFKSYMSDRDREHVAEVMLEHSKYYAEIIGTLKHPILEEEIGNIREQKTNVAQPFILKILADHGNGIVSDSDAREVCDLISSYLLRSRICGTQKGVDREFPAMNSKINTDRYLESVKNAFIDMPKRMRLPRDVTFREYLMNFSLGSNEICKYLLVRLEQSRNKKEQVEPETLQIEHIMPKKLSKAWKEDLGKDWESVHEKYLDTIGNLTLTGYNPNMGNRPFCEKKEISYASSNISITRDLKNYDRWGKKQIEERAKLLVDIAVELWKCPEGYDDDDDSEEQDTGELEYLEGKNTVELWYKLKEAILSSCSETRFNMMQRWGSIRLYNKDKSVGICSLITLKNTIHIVHNTKIDEGVITPSEFTKDVSGVGHYGNGDLQSTVMTEDDVIKVVELVRSVYKHKMAGLVQD